MINHFAHQLDSEAEAEGEGGEVGKGVELGASGVVGSEEFFLLFSKCAFEFVAALYRLRKKFTVFGIAVEKLFLPYQRSSSSVIGRSPPT